jgi:hypothetical protein
LSEFLDQLVGMFRVQAAAKASTSCSSGLRCCPSWSMPTKSAAPGPDQPAVERAQVHADRQRAVRRALPQPGRRVRGDRYRPGIQAGDLERIFAPFERGALGVSQPQTGTGSGSPSAGCLPA